MSEQNTERANAPLVTDDFSEFGAAGLAGTRYLTLDRKGRVVVPAQFRQQLGHTFVITRAPDRCLLLLSTSQWAQLANHNATIIDFREFFVSGAVHVTPAETTGRIPIPSALREWAGLQYGEEVALAGLGASVAVSSRSVWDERLRRIQTGLLQSLDASAEGRAL